MKHNHKTNHRAVDVPREPSTPMPPATRPQHHLPEGTSVLEFVSLLSWCWVHPYTSTV